MICCLGKWWTFLKKSYVNVTFLLQKLEELEKEEELRETAGLYDSEPVSVCVFSFFFSLNGL